MSDLIRMRHRPPRFDGGDNWGSRLRIGLLIDWLDSRPEHLTSDVKALRKKSLGNDMVALAAAGLTDRIGRQRYAGELAFGGHNDHDTEYDVEYHAHITGHLAPDELAIGDEVYVRLTEVAPGCLSGLVNLAELERRRRRVERARALLEQALARAQTSTDRRYGVADSKWAVTIRCAIARITGDAGAGSALLAAAAAGQLRQMVELLRTYPSWDAAALPAHQAFSAATAAQRIVLHAAMRLAPIGPKPPPSAHEGAFEALAAVERMVRSHHPI